MNTNRFLVLAICLALIFILSSCNGRGAAPGLSDGGAMGQGLESQEEASMRQIRLPYHPDDTLNPYTCQTIQNFYLSGLLYDSLVALDDHYQPQNRLAQKIDIQDGVRVEITLRPDAVFSDGLLVTSAEVAESLALARNSSLFAPGLRGIQSVETPTPTTLVIFLETPDIFFTRSLCFPILKTGVKEESEPIGGGRFILNLSAGQLTPNPYFYIPVKNIETIELVAVNSLEAQGQSMLKGELDLFYSDMRGKIDLGLGLRRRQVPMSNLVYLGVNSRRWGNAPERLRLLSDVIDREAILRKAYLGYGAATFSFFNPAYSEAPFAGVSPEVRIKELNARLDALGYIQRDGEGYRLMGDGPLEFTLLVNRDNAERETAVGLIADFFSQVGIRIRIVRTTWEVYQYSIATGDYDLYLGETKIPYNMDFSALLTPNRSFGTEIPAHSEVTTAYAQAKAGKLSLEELDQILHRYMPIIPLLYRRGVFCFSHDFSANMVATEQDIFYNIVDW